jgi:hypothetical protein
MGRAQRAAKASLTASNSGATRQITPGQGSEMPRNSEHTHLRKARPMPAPRARPCDLYRASEITCVQTRRAESSPTIIHGEATFPTGRTSAGPTYWPAAAGPPLPLGPSEAAIAVQATSACSAGYDANVSKWRVGKPPGCVAETTAPPGEVVVADGDSAGAVFQSVHMHRHVVACSIARVEQTSAAPGFAQMEQRLRRRWRGCLWTKQPSRRLPQPGGPRLLPDKTSSRLLAARFE